MVLLCKEKSKITGQIERVIIEDRTRKHRPKLVIEKDGKVVVEYPLPVGTTLVVKSGDEIKVGDVLAKMPKEATKVKDITGGLPRVSELFEGRKPKNVAVVSEIDGIVKFGEATKKGALKVKVIDTEANIEKEYTVPLGRHLVVYEGDKVEAGEALSDGAINPHDILKVKGPKVVQEYLVNEIQQVYRLQGVSINDKHIEVVVRQMLSNVRITEEGDSKFLKGEIISRYKYEKERKKNKR